MGETFEEVVCRRLSALYAATRFLSAGRDALAQELLADALVQAFSRYGTWAWDAAGLERAIVDEALHRWRMGLPPAGGGPEESAPKPASPRPLPAPMEMEGMLSESDARRLYLAARHIPVRGRIAIWLVSLEGWTYQDAAEALGVGREELMDLLSWRETMLLHTLPVMMDAARIHGQG